jgi:hypothetical protein
MAENEVTFDIRASRARLPADLAAAEREIVAKAREAAQKAREQVRRVPMRFGVDEQATRNELARVLRSVREDIKRQRVEVALGIRYNRGDLDALERARFAATGPAGGAAGGGSFARTGALVIGGTVAAAQLSRSIANAIANVRDMRSSDNLTSLEGRAGLSETARSIPLFGSLFVGPLRDAVGSITGFDRELQDAIGKQKAYNSAVDGAVASLRSNAIAVALGRQVTGLGELAVRQQNELGAFDAETARLTSGENAPRVRRTNSRGGTFFSIDQGAVQRLELQRRAARDQLVIRQREERTRAIEDARAAEEATRTNAIQKAERNLRTFEDRVGRQSDSDRDNPLIQLGNQLQRRILQNAVDRARNDQAIARSAALQRARDEEAKQQAEKAQREANQARERVRDAEREAADAARDYAARLQDIADQAGRQFDLRRRLEGLDADAVRRDLQNVSQGFAATDLRFINAERGASPDQQRKVEQSLNTLNQLTREQVGLIRQIAQSGINLAILGP